VRSRARPSPREEQLEREVASLRRQLDAIRQDPGDYPELGCGDSSCIVAHPKGMRTNGGCRCDERTLRRAVMWWRRRGEFLLETIRELRARGPVEGA
jgi:hypothetical protein